MGEIGMVQVVFAQQEQTKLTETVFKSVYLPNL